MRVDYKSMAFVAVVVVFSSAARADDGHDHPPPSPAPGAPAGAAASPTQTKLKVAAFDLQSKGQPEDLVQALSAAIPETLERLGVFDTISSQEIRKLLSYEADKQHLGCDDASCLADIGGALGADYLLTGNLTQVSGTYVLQMQLMRTAGAYVVERVSREHSGDPKGLFDIVRGATQAVVRQLLEAKAGKLALVGVEEGATLRIDERVIGTTPVGELTVAGGVHLISLEKEGFVPFKLDVDIKADIVNQVKVAMRPSEAWLADYKANASFVRNLGWAGLGVGLAAGVAGGLLLGVGGSQAKVLDTDVKRYNDNPERSTAAFDELQSRQRSIARLDVGALISLAAAAVAVVTGVTLIAVGDDPDRYEVETSAGPAVTWMPTGLGIAGRF